MSIEQGIPVGNSSYVSTSVTFHVEGAPGIQLGITSAGGYNPVAAIPEPETYAMLLAGLGLLGFMAKRRKQKLAA
jgi:hypothetical protein